LTSFCRPKKKQQKKLLLNILQNIFCYSQKKLSHKPGLEQHEGE